MGNPTKIQWPNGFKLANQIGFKFPWAQPVPLKKLIQNASDDALDLITQML